VEEKMKKEDLLKLVAAQADITNADARKAVQEVLEGISSALETGDSVSLIGFGSFKVVKRAAREGRNPQTGETIQIPASKAVKFTVGKLLKERVQ
jgi:DNA-binding protein HU-beta